MRLAWERDGGRRGVYVNVNNARPGVHTGAPTGRRRRGARFAGFGGVSDGVTIVPRRSSPSPDARARSLVEDFALVVILVRLAELVGACMLSGATALFTVFSWNPWRRGPGGRSRSSFEAGGVLRRELRRLDTLLLHVAGHRGPRLRRARASGRWTRRARGRIAIATRVPAAGFPERRRGRRRGRWKRRT